MGKQETYAIQLDEFFTLNPGVKEAFEKWLSEKVKDHYGEKGKFYPPLSSKLIVYPNISDSSLEQYAINCSIGIISIDS